MNTSLKLFALAGLLCFSNAFAAEVSSAAASSYRRELTEENGQTVYIVTRRATHLFMISRDLYGDAKYWSQIAAANSLSKPYDLEIGQKLILKRAPTTTATEGNRILMKAWAGLDRWDIVEGIVLSQQGQTQSAPQIEPAPIAEKIETPEVKEEPTSSSAAQIEELIKAEKPQPEEPGKQAEHSENAVSHDGKFGFSVSLLGLVTELDSNWESENSHTVLYTDIDYGVEAKLAYTLSDSFSLTGLAALEHLKIRSSDDGTEVEGNDRNLLHFAVGTGFRVARGIVLSLAYHYKEEPLVRPTTESAEIETLFLSQILAGPRFTVIRTNSFETVLGADYLYSLAKNEKGFDLKDGQGFEAFLEFENHLSFGKLLYGAKYRQLTQDTSESKDSQKVYTANLGLGW